MKYLNLLKMTTYVLCQLAEAFEDAAQRPADIITTGKVRPERESQSARLTRALMGSGELHVMMGGGPKGPPPYLQISVRAPLRWFVSESHEPAVGL